MLEKVDACSDVHPVRPYLQHARKIFEYPAHHARPDGLLLCVVMASLAYCCGSLGLGCCDQNSTWCEVACVCNGHCRPEIRVHCVLLIAPGHSTAKNVIHDKPHIHFDGEHYSRGTCNCPAHTLPQARVRSSWTTPSGKSESSQAWTDPASLRRQISAPWRCSLIQ